MKLQKKKNSFFIQPLINGKRVSIPLGSNRLLAGKIRDKIQLLVEYTRAGIELTVELKTWVKSLDTTFTKLLISKGV